MNLDTEKMQQLIQLLIDVGTDVNAIFPSAATVDATALTALAALKQDTLLLGFLVSVLNKV